MSRESSSQLCWPVMTHVVFIHTFQPASVLQRLHDSEGECVSTSQHARLGRNCEWSWRRWSANVSWMFKALALLSQTYHRWIKDPHGSTWCMSVVKVLGQWSTILSAWRISWRRWDESMKDFRLQMSLISEPRALTAWHSRRKWKRETTM